MNWWRKLDGLGKEISLWCRKVVWGACLSLTFLSCLDFLQRVSCITVILKNQMHRLKRKVLWLRWHFWSLHPCCKNKCLLFFGVQDGLDGVTGSPDRPVWALREAMMQDTRRETWKGLVIPSRGEEPPDSFSPGSWCPEREKQHRTCRKTAGAPVRRGKGGPKQEDKQEVNTGDVLSESFYSSQARGSQPWQFCPQGHLEMSGDIWGDTWGGGLQLAFHGRARDIAN